MHMNYTGRDLNFSSKQLQSWAKSVIKNLALSYPQDVHCTAQVPPPGFAKSRPAAQRPTALGPRRPSGPKAQRPGGPAAWRPGGPVLIFHSFLAVNPRTCTDLHRVWACKMDDGEFELVYHFNNHFNPFRSFLSFLSEKRCHSLFICLFM